jgi:hypothetical protein
MPFSRRLRSRGPERASSLSARAGERAHTHGRIGGSPRLTRLEGNDMTLPTCHARVAAQAVPLSHPTR